MLSDCQALLHAVETDDLLVLKVMGGLGNRHFLAARIFAHLAR
jgi:hypothetical protein